MAWHPATGLGVIALGNLRYAQVGGAAGEALAGLVREGHAPRRSVRPTPVVERFRDVAEGLLARWDDAVADEAFAMNLDLDEPRRPAAGRGGEGRRGSLDRSVATRIVRVSSSSAHLRWWLRGERGWAELEILVTPEAEPRLQTLRVTPGGGPVAGACRGGERLLAAAARACAGLASRARARREALDLAGRRAGAAGGRGAVRDHAPGPPDGRRRPGDDDLGAGHATAAARPSGWRWTRSPAPSTEAALQAAAPRPTRRRLVAVHQATCQATRDRRGAVSRRGSRAAARTAQGRTGARGAR